jgi:hypothetical protein
MIQANVVRPITLFLDLHFQPKCIMLIEDGRIVQYLNRHELESTNTNNLYDMVIYEHRDSDGNTDILRFDCPSELSDDFEYSEGKLHNPTVKIFSNACDGSTDDEQFEISFGNRNYLVVGNVLFDYKFMKWWFYWKYNREILEDTNYSLTFFDKDMNVVTIGPKQYLIITPEGHEVMFREDFDSSDEEPPQEGAATDTEDEDPLAMELADGGGWGLLNLANPETGWLGWGPIYRSKND